jgi:hypothetical protein
MEVGSYTNSSASVETVYLAVDQYCGDDVPFRIVLIESCPEELSFESGAFGAPEMYGHSTSSSAAAIGAVFFCEVDESGAFIGDTGVVDPQPFSSMGGSLPFYYDPSGNTLGAPEYRSKPDCSAPDGGNTSFFGVDLPYDDDSMPNFVGTSSAAAHAAGIAALVLQYEPTTDVDALMERLRLTAVDIGEPGWDAISGDGRLDALRAITYDTSLPLTLTGFDAVVYDGDVTLRWATASEVEVAGYDVQRRDEDSQSYSSVSFVTAENTESATYEIRVDDLQAGSHVFRLRMVDLDGTFTYSPDVEVQISLVDTYALSSVYPNPFSPDATNSVSVDRTQDLQIGVFDLTGKQVALLHSGVLEGGQSHRFRITSDRWATGIYFVKVVGASFSDVRPAVLVK